MSSVEVRGEFRAPIGRVWEYLSDFGGVKRWNPYPQRVEVRGHGIGMVRVVTAQNGETADEELLSCDPDRHLLRYSVVPTSDLRLTVTTPLTTTIELSGVRQGSTSITWQAHSDGEMDAKVRHAISAALRMRIDALAAFLARELARES